MVDFYFGKNSGNSARCALALYEVGVSFTAHVVELRRPRSAEYLRLNPLGKAPTLIAGATTLWESNAINWYLAETHPEAQLLPSTPEGRAHVLRWVLFQTSHVSPAATAVHRALNPTHARYFGQPSDPQDAERGAQELARFLPVLERALENADWLLGDYSLADIAFAPHLGFLLQRGYEFPGTPRVRRWLERIRARPAWQNAHALIFDDYAA